MNQHDILWAPWRMEYIKSEKGGDELPKLKVAEGGNPDCFICQAYADSENDRRRLVVGRTQWTVTLLNRFPYNNGHLLVAPIRHISRMDLLAPEEAQCLMSEITYWIGKIEKTMNAEGFNVGLNLGRVAGAGLPGHMHWHIVPRWNGDANFMTTTCSAKSIPQALDTAWEMLRRE